MAVSTPTERKVNVTTLANGVRVVSETMPHVRSVSVGIWIRTGSRREVGAENGLSHFIEHMLFKGTTSRSAEDIARSVDSIGGNLDAFTSKELVSYNTKVMDEHLPLAFDVLSDLVLRPMFREEDIEKEKGVILEELKMEVDNPEYLIHEVFSNSFWEGHPLGKSIIGTKPAIKKFAKPLVSEYYRRVYSPSNILITAAGRVEHDQILRLVEDQFGSLVSGGSAPAESRPVTHAQVILKNKKSLQQTHLCLGVPAYPLAHELRFACYALNTLLGGGMSSRLFQNIREKLGLVYSVYSELNLFRDTGCLMVGAGTATETARQVVGLILEEFRRLKDERVSDEELRRAKDHLKGSLMLGLESTYSRMANLARQDLFFDRFFSLDELVDDIESVTAAQIQDIARHFFQPENVALTLLGNLNGLEITRDHLVC